MSNYDIIALALLFIIALIKYSEFLINTKITLLTMLFALIIVASTLCIFLILFDITSP